MKLTMTMALNLTPVTKVSEGECRASRADSRLLNTRLAYVTPSNFANQRGILWNRRGPRKPSKACVLQFTTFLPAASSLSLPLPTQVQILSGRSFPSRKHTLPLSSSPTPGACSSPSLCWDLGQVDE